MTEPELAARRAWHVAYQRAFARHRAAVGSTSDEQHDRVIGDALKLAYPALRGTSVARLKQFRVDGDSSVTVAATEELAAALADVMDADELLSRWREIADAGPSPTVDLEEPTDPTAAMLSAGAPASRRWIPVVVLAGVVAVVVLVVVVIARPRSAPSTADPAPAATIPGTLARPPCDVPVGDVDETVSALADVDAVRAGLSRLARTAVDGTDVCPVAPAYRWGTLVVQEMRQGDAPAGALVVRADGAGDGWRMGRALWGTYHQTVEARQQSAQLFVGDPVAITQHPDGHLEMTTTVGALFVAERADAPAFWITPLHVAWWQARRAETGLPAGNPRGDRLRQDFALGVGSVASGNLAEPTFTAVADPAADLPAGPNGGRLRAVILHQEDGTSWWVPDEGVRQWIPDVATYECLGGDGARATQLDTPGWAVTTLSYDGIARCT